MAKGYQRLNDDIDLRDKGLRKFGLWVWTIAYYITPGFGFFGLGGVRQLASYVISMVVLPAAHPRFLARSDRKQSKKVYLAKMDEQENKWKELFNLEKLCYKVGRKVKLEGVRLSSLENKANATDVHVFYLMGNDATIDMTYTDMCTDVVFCPDSINLIAHCINPRGAAKSTGHPWSVNDLVQDYYKVIKYHIDQDIQEGETKEQASRRFNVKGHSLGSGYGPLLSLKLHQNGYPVNFNNGASFSTPARAKLGRIPIIAPLADFILWLAGWHMPSADAFYRLPPSSRSHHVVKAGKAKEGKAETDGQISYYGSLHYALKPSRKKEKKILSETIADLRALIDTESLAEKSRLQSLIKSHEKVISNWYYLVMGWELTFSDLNDPVMALVLLRKLEKLKDHYFKGNKMTSFQDSKAHHDMSLTLMKSRSSQGINGHQWFINTIINKLHFHQNHTKTALNKKPRSPYFFVRHRNALLLSMLVGVLLISSPWLLPSLAPVVGFGAVLAASASVSLILNIGLSLTASYALGSLINFALIVLGGLGLDVLRVKIENNIQDTDKLDITEMKYWRKVSVQGNGGIELKPLPTVSSTANEGSLEVDQAERTDDFDLSHGMYWLF